MTNALELLKAGFTPHGDDKLDGSGRSSIITHDGWWIGFIYWNREVPVRHPLGGTAYYAAKIEFCSDAKAATRRVGQKPPWELYSPADPANNEW